MTVTDGLTHSPRAVLDPRRSVAETARHDSTYGPLPVMLLILTAFTGVVDAVSILALGRVFVANMTGNVIFVGFELTGAPGFSLVASLVGLAGFLIGARAGGHLIRRMGDDHGTLFATGSSFELVLVVATFVLVVSAGIGSP